MLKILPILAIFILAFIGGKNVGVSEKQIQAFDRLSSTSNQGSQGSSNPTSGEESYSEKTIEELIVETFPDEPEIALAIARCESRLDPKAINHNDAKYTGYKSWGLFQLNRPEFEEWANPEVNIKEAKKLFLRRGFQPWSCFTNNRYLAFMEL